MTDRNGESLTVGDRFLYQVGTEFQIEGKLFDVDGTEVIKWNDNEIISVEDFYYAPSDMKELQRI